MKRNELTSRILALIMALTLLFASCTNDDTTTTADEQQITQEELKMAAEMDAIEMTLDEMINGAVDAQEIDGTGRISNPPMPMPDCVTVTVVAQLNHREITIDFGTDGCLINGHLLKGQIFIEYDRDINAQELLINYSLINFFVDLKQVIGNRTILRELSNDNGNPQFTHSLQLTVIWPNGMQASRDGLKVREWVEGFGSGQFADNVFEITGHWNSTFINGNTHNHLVITPLRREATCPHFVSGSVDVERTNVSGILDFGDGSCDNLATFTFDNGNVINITLN